MHEHIEVRNHHTNFFSTLFAPEFQHTCMKIIILSYHINCEAYVKTIINKQTEKTFFATEY
jgi:hypothetical protein